MNRNALHVDPTNSGKWKLSICVRSVRPLDPTEPAPRVVARPPQRHRITPRSRAFRPARATRRVEGSGDGDDPPPPRRGLTERLKSPRPPRRRP